MLNLAKIGRFAACAWLGMAGLGGAALADTFTYVGNATSSTINVFRLDPATGAMQALQTVPFQGVSKPGESTPMVVSHDKRFLFVGVRSRPYQVLTYAIDPESGRLRFVASGRLADAMANLDLDRTGEELFSASYPGNKVAVNPVSANGIVGDPSQVIPTGIKAHAIHADLNDRFVFATNLGSDQVLAFRFDPATGALTPSAHPVIKLQAHSGPRHFIFSADQRFIYLVDETDGAVKVFRYGAADGTWTLLQKTTALPPGFTGVPWAADLHLTPDGRFLYTSERRSSTLKAFRVDPRTGLLTGIESVSTEHQPRGFAIDPSGHYLAAVGELSTQMSVYRIDQTTGRLTPIGRYPVGRRPNWIEFVAFPNG